MSLLRLKYERIKRHWSQTELGRRAGGLRAETIGLIESGRLQPTEDQLRRLAIALAMSPPAILLIPTVLADEAEAEALVAERDTRRQVARV